MVLVQIWTLWNFWINARKPLTEYLDYCWAISPISITQDPENVTLHYTALPSFSKLISSHIELFHIRLDTKLVTGPNETTKNAPNQYKHQEQWT